MAGPFGSGKQTPRADDRMRAREVREGVGGGWGWGEQILLERKLDKKEHMLGVTDAVVQSWKQHGTIYINAGSAYPHLRHFANC